MSNDALQTIEKPPGAGQDVPCVSVLLPAWNEEAMLGRCLESLLAIGWASPEIIVSAGGADRTFAIASEYAASYPDRVILLEQRPGEGKQQALWRCLGRARGEVLYFTDADCVVPEAAYRAVVSAVAEGSADAATGTADPLPEQRRHPFVRHQWAATRAVDRVRGAASTGLLGRNFAASRAAIDACGGFAEPVRIGTDYHLAMTLLAAGRTIRFVPAPVLSRYHEDVPSYLRQQSRWLRNIYVHGIRFRDRAELVGATRAIATGTLLLLWPLGWRWTRLPGVALWAAAVGWMARERIKRGRALDDEFGEAGMPGLPAWRRGAWYSLVDIVAWAQPVVDLALRTRRWRW